MTAAFLGGVTWALSPVVLPAVGVAAGAYAVGAIVGGLLKKDDDSQEELELPELHRGTEQAELVESLSRFIDDLRTLREAPKPDVVVDPSIQALVSTEHAYPTAVRVAAAVDGLDVALSRTGGPTGNQQVREAVQRMSDRREALLANLRGTVDEVAEVYTKLLEMSAAVGSLDLTMSAAEDVDKVNTSLDSLRHTLAELEAEATRPT